MKPVPPRMRMRSGLSARGPGAPVAASAADACASAANVAAVEAWRTSRRVRAMVAGKHRPHPFVRTLPAAALAGLEHRANLLQPGGQLLFEAILGRRVEPLAAQRVRQVVLRNVVPLEVVGVLVAAAVPQR